MIKIMFVCYGNICRSPMAEFVLKDMTDKRGIKKFLMIDSSSTSREEIGNPVHNGTRNKLSEYGISVEGKYAVQLTRSDYDKYDYILGMEQINIKNILKITDGDPEGKVKRLLDFSKHPRDIADPWYTGDFDSTYRDIYEGCETLLDYLCNKEGEYMSDAVKKFKILAVDDDPIILNSVLSTLSEEYNVSPVTSGKTALKFLQKKTADLILLDCYMPEMSGFEVLEKLQENPDTKEIPVIFLTGSIEADSESEALSMGARDYILKPLRPQALLTRVQLQLELQEHRKNLEALVEEKTWYLNAAYNKLKLREDITLNLLARVTDLRDSETGDHIERTTEIVRILVKDLHRNPRPGYEISRHDSEDIIKSAKLHDIGKIAIPDNILLKPGKLTEEEFITIKRHTNYAKELLDEFLDRMGDDSFLKIARDIAYFHHEKWNGTGYPLGLSEIQIPLCARLVALADVYDALISVRPYKKPFTHEKAMQIILEDSGKHFDPYLVTVFEKNSEEIRRTNATMYVEE